MTSSGDDGVAMVDRDEPDDHGDPAYDIQLRRRPPESLRARYPCGRMHTTPTQTALLGRVSEPGQLDNLLQKLCSVGLVLNDVHRLIGTSAPEDDAVVVYEVRVEGELGAPLLRYLRWQHYIVPEQTWVRIAAESADLQEFLKAYADAGASIERVSRVRAARHPDHT